MVGINGARQQKALKNKKGSEDPFFVLEQNEQYRNNDSARYTNDVVRYMLTFCLLAVPVGSIADNTRTHSPQKNGCKWDEVKDG